MVLPAVLARGRGRARTAALARSAHRSRRRAADEGRSNQHGAFARGAAAAARSSPGGVHAERRSGAPGRSATAARQIAGAPAHGAAAAARASGSAEVRVRAAGASMAQASSARACTRRSRAFASAACCNARWAPNFVGRGRSWCSTAGSPPLAEPGSRILFVPVSGPYGMGEYARCSAIARAARVRWPHAAVHFVLSRHAPYAAERRFPRPRCPRRRHFIRPPSSISSSVAPQRRHLRQCRTHRAAARGAALGRAHRVHQCSQAPAAQGVSAGAGCVCIDEHWIAYPELIAGELGLIERLKLKLLRRPVVRYLDVIMARARGGLDAAARSRACGRRAARVLVVPGGGTGHPGARGCGGAISGRRARPRGGRRDGVRGPDGGTPASRRTTVSAASRPALRCSVRCRRRTRGAHARRAAGRHERRLHAAAGDRLRRACIAAPIARISASASVAAPPPASRSRRRRAPPTSSESARASRGRAARAALARRAASLKLADGVEVALDALADLSKRQLRAEAHAECRAAGLRSRSAFLPASHAQPRAASRSAPGWQVRAERFPSGRYGLRTWERRALLRWADVVVLHQIKLSADRGAAVRRLQPAPRIRRGRCHLRAQAAPARRAAR